MTLHLKTLIIKDGPRPKTKLCWFMKVFGQSLLLSFKQKKKGYTRGSVSEWRTNKFNLYLRPFHAIDLLHSYCTVHILMQTLQLIRNKNVALIQHLNILQRGSQKIVKEGPRVQGPGSKSPEFSQTPWEQLDCHMGSANTKESVHWVCWEK